jgi:nucleotide-binding universal stress UspA family protein
MSCSEGATAAVDVAASFAKAIHEPLLLIHANESTARRRLPENLNESLRRFLHDQFEETANHLRASETPIKTAFHSGEPATSLLTEITEHGARLLVLGAPLDGEASRQLAFAVVRETPIPTLIVRQPAPLKTWLSGERELRVLVGINFSSASWVALRWVKWLRELGTCDVTVAVLEPKMLPPAGAAIHCKAEADDLARQTTKAQERFFRRLVDTLLGRPRLRVRFEYGFAHSDAHFIELAREARADLVAFGIGAPDKGPGNDQPIWPGVLRYGPFNVALIPRQFDGSGDALLFPAPEQTKP